MVFRGSRSLSVVSLFRAAPSHLASVFLVPAGFLASTMTAANEINLLPPGAFADIFGHCTGTADFIVVLRSPIYVVSDEKLHALARLSSASLSPARRRVLARSNGKNLEEHYIA